jgi:hypothetical protein
LIKQNTNPSLAYSTGGNASYQQEEEEKAVARLNALRAAWPDKPDLLSSEDLSILRELFGAKFLTPDYHLSSLDIIAE